MDIPRVGNSIDWLPYLTHILIIFMGLYMLLLHTIIIAMSAFPTLFQKLVCDIVVGKLLQSARVMLQWAIDHCITQVMIISI